MKQKAFLFLFTLLLSVSLYAQEALWGGQDIISPEVNENNTVTFRLKAPNAKKVEVTGNFLPTRKINTSFGEFDVPGVAELKKNKEGIWEYTSEALASELYSYTFIADSLQLNDPGNVHMIRDVASVTNFFIVKGEPGNLYSVNAVPHGTVTRRWYNSPTLNKERRLTIYTPPGYEADEKNYPVLYLLHGMGGDEEAWIALGRTAQIMDNLIAQGKATPMIIVMPNGNVDQQAAPGESDMGLYKPNMQLPRTMEGSMEGSFPDIVKFVDSNYRTIKQKSGRAIAGLSMGGFHSLHISKEYPDMFDYVGLFSAAITPNKDAKSPIYDHTEGKLNTQFGKNPTLYWIAIGKTDFLYSDNVAYRDMLTKAGYNYEYFENEGGHIWKNWRIYLSMYVQMLF